MFDNLSQKNSTDQNNITKENKPSEEALPKSAAPVSLTGSPQRSPEPVEDIFSKTDPGADASSGQAGGTAKADKPDVFKPKEPVDSGTGPGETEGDLVKQEKMKKILIFAIIIMVLIVVILAGFWAFSGFLNKAETPVISEVENEQNLSQEQNLDQESGAEISDTTQPADSVPAASNESKEQETIKPIDSDQDGLTDEEERRLGLDINSVDTDNDGLFDREEVKVYETDPLNADTDGDGYLDGEEVKGGYNPIGPGRLYETD